MRHNSRQADELRALTITRNFTKNAAGSVLICTGNTHVLCTASIEERVPFHLRGKNQGWITAEYSMLPGSTVVRSAREAARGRQGGRTQEIQRLIGRSLRASVDLAKLGERTIIVDCDVLQADGGTRCASISGGFVALADAIAVLKKQKKINHDPVAHHVAAVSVGIVNDHVVLDVDYNEDSTAQVDMNFVMNESGQFIEVQGTAENGEFTRDQLNEMAAMAALGTEQLINAQKTALAE